jgi:hypothetical protein
MQDETRELSDGELEIVAGGFTATEHGAKTSGRFEVEDYSFDIEQTLSIGSR